MQHLDMSLRPHTITGRADIEQPIRDALADAPAHATVELAGLTLILDFCAYPGGTPIWDKPLVGHSGVVTAHRPDGETVTIRTDDGHDWDDLTRRLLDFLDDWDVQQAALLTEVRDRGRRIMSLEQQIANETAALKPLMQQADREGVTKYRLAQLTGMTQPRVARLTKLD